MTLSCCSHEDPRVWRHPASFVLLPALLLVSVTFGGLGVAHAEEQSATSHEVSVSFTAMSLAWHIGDHPDFGEKLDLKTFTATGVGVAYGWMPWRWFELRPQAEVIWSWLSEFDRAAFILEQRAVLAALLLLRSSDGWSIYSFGVEGGLARFRANDVTSGLHATGALLLGYRRRVGGQTWAHIEASGGSSGPEVAGRVTDYSAAVLRLLKLSVGLSCAF